VACSGGARKEGAPAPAADGAPAASVAPAPASAAFAALTRPKFSDDEYIAAIADLESATGAGDAAVDIAAGRRRLLATPGHGSPVIPGVGISRRQLPEGVRIVRIAGFVEGSENRQIARFQMLALRYATAYNTAMLPAAR